ncbi:kinase-like protein [Hymenopellis radicata]|nr:kinase-like protein [Hymenopellis radicata]
MTPAPSRKPRSSVEAKRRRIVSARPLHWAQLNHRNVVELIGVTWVDHSPLLIFPDVGCGNVKDFVCAHNGCNKLDIVGLVFQKASSSDSNSVQVTQAAQGLQYLHTIRPLFVHGDVRAENLLIGSDGIVCWTGFLFLPTPNDESTRWQPPEVLRNFDGQFHRSRDIYAFGSLLIELVTEECPFAYVSSDEQVIQDVCAYKRPKRPYTLDRLSSDLWDLAERCHSHQPENRISCSSIARALKKAARRNFASDTEITPVLLAREHTSVKGRSLLSRSSGHASRHGAIRALGSLSPDIDLRALTLESSQLESLPPDLGWNDRIAATSWPRFGGAPVIPLPSGPPVYPSPYLVERSSSPEMELPANQWLSADVLSREIYGLFYPHLEPPSAFVMVVESILQSGCIRSHIILDIAVWYVHLYQRAYHSSMGTFDDMAVVTAVCMLLAVQFWDDDTVFGSTYRFHLPALARLTGFDRSVLQTVHDKIAFRGFINLHIYSLEQIRTRRAPQTHTWHNQIGWMQ